MDTGFTDSGFYGRIPLYVRHLILYFRCLLMPDFVRCAYDKKLVSKAAAREIPEYIRKGRQSYVLQGSHMR